jgi:hypothetical protein
LTEEAAIARATSIKEPVLSGLCSSCGDVFFAFLWRVRFCGKKTCRAPAGDKSKLWRGGIGGTLARANESYSFNAYLEREYGLEDGFMSEAGY